MKSRSVDVELKPVTRIIFFSNRMSKEESSKLDQKKKKAIENFKLNARMKLHHPLAVTSNIVKKFKEEYNKSHDNNCINI